MGSRALRIAMTCIGLAACGEAVDVAQPAEPPPTPGAADAHELEASTPADSRRREQSGAAEPAIDAADPVATAARVLRDPRTNEGQRVTAVKDLTALGKEALPTLVALLDDPEAASWAILAISRMGPDGLSALGKIAGLLGNKQVGDVAQTAMIEAGAPAIPLLLEALEDPSADARWRAVFALGSIESDDPRVVPALVAKLRDADAVRLVAVGSLGRLHREAAVALPALVSVLRDPNQAVRKEAANSIGEFGADAASCVDALKSTFADQDSHVAAAGIAALGRIGPGASAVAPTLVQIARSNPDWTPHTIHALVRIAPERVAEFLSGDDERLRLAVAADSMGLYDETPAPPDQAEWRRFHSDDPALVASWDRALGDSLARVRVAAIAETRRRGVVDANETALRTSLSFDDGAVRRAAVATLGDAKTPSQTLVADVAARLKDDDPGVRMQAADSLRRLASVPSVTLPALVAALDDPQPEVAALAARAIGAWGKAAADFVPDLRRCLGREDAWPRLCAAEALSTLEPGSNEGAAALVRLLTDANGNIRKGAVEALAATNRKDMVPPLIERLDDGNRDVRIAAAKALSGFGVAADGAAPTLLRMLGSRDDSIVQAARDALTAIRPK